MSKDLFPYELTSFINKVNARYEGDPLGDFVLAEHVNEVQDAVTRIEESLGIRSKEDSTIEERLSQLSRYSLMKIDSVGYFNTLVNESAEYVSSFIEKYKIIIIDEHDNNTKLLSKDKDIYGRINASVGSLNDIQNKINTFKENGAVGIYLDGLDRGTREEEIKIVRSVNQESLKLIVYGETNKLLNQTPSDKNPRGEKIPFELGTTFTIKDFGYSEKTDTPGNTPKENVINNLLPLVQTIKDEGHQILAMTDTPNKDVFNYIHTLGLMLSIDYLYTGVVSGSSIDFPPYEYVGNSIIANWKTNKPKIYHEQGRLYRNIENGSIEIDEKDKVTFHGLATSSDTIEWVVESIEGRAIKSGTIPPDRLSTYDVDRIVKLINESSREILIQPDKIDSDDTSGLLPDAIGASHMIANVIEAINKKNNRNSEEVDFIESSAILNLTSDKLRGDIERERIDKNVIEAINFSSSTQIADVINFIKIPYAEITNIKGHGIDYITVKGEDASFVEATISSLLTADKVSVLTSLESPYAEIGHVKSDTIEALEIKGLDKLTVKDLNAENMEALVLNAVKAEIGVLAVEEIIAGSIETDYIKAELIKAVTTFSTNTVGEKARYDSLVANVFNANIANMIQLNAGEINTDKISLMGPEGNLEIKGDTIKIQSAPDENNESRIRILLGKLNEFTHKDDPDKPDEFGFMALSEDGESQIFDHTGVYSAGIHDNAVIHEKIAEGSIDTGQIRHDAIMADHILAGTITADELSADSVTADKIVAGAIDADHISSLSIDTKHLMAGLIESTHLKSTIIEGEHIKANAISSEHLSIGFKTNLIKDGMDSFEQLKLGEVSLNPSNKDVKTIVEKGHTFDGNNLVRASSYENNGHLYIGKKLRVGRLAPTTEDGIPKQFGLSIYSKVEWGAANTSIRLGFMLSNDDGTSEHKYSENKTITRFFKRESFIVENTKNYEFITPIIVFTNSNDTILFDAVQLEEVDKGKEVSQWRSTATTDISGDNIKTGRVDAGFIKIGQGTSFGDGQIIEISDEGILARRNMVVDGTVVHRGSAHLGSSGLVIEGGAFKLTGGQNGQRVRIEGHKGITVDNAKSKIELDAEKGFRISNLVDNQVILDIDSTTGQLKISGDTRFYNKNSPDMNISFIEQEDEIRRQREEAKEQAKKLKTQEETQIAQQKIIDEQIEELRIEKEAAVVRQAEINKERVLRNLEEQGKKHSLILEMKVGYSSYTQVNENYLYFHGYKVVDNEYIPANVPGEIHSAHESTKFPIPNQSLFLGGVPKGTAGHVIWDNTKKEMDFIYLKSEIDKKLNVTQKWVKTKPNDEFDFNESVFVIGEVVT